MFVRYNLFGIVWAIVIFLLILMPGGEMPKMEEAFSFDKLAHTGVFCILNFLLIIGFTKQFTYKALSRNPVKWSVLFSIVYASGLELGQALVPDRYANFYDLAFNLFGVLLGYVLYLLVYKYSFV